MFPSTSQTLQRPITVEGHGLHSNSLCRVMIHPSNGPSGLRFRHAASGTEIRALAERVGDLSLATTLERDGVRFATVEHLLSALAGLGVDHALIEVDGEELPILDGSAAPWVDAILEAGIREMPGVARRSVRILKPIEVRNGDKWVKVEPYPALRLRYTIDFNHPAIGRQSRELTLSPEKYRKEVAAARTFCMERDIEFMRSHGLALGGSLDNAVVYGDKGPLNESLRYQDEAVRHKMLDLVGDLALLGAPLQGMVSAHAAGHAMHVALVKAIQDDPSAWTWTAAEPTQPSRSYPAGLGHALPA